jgi:hypothetical protein
MTPIDPLSFNPLPVDEEALRETLNMATFAADVAVVSASRDSVDEAGFLSVAEMVRIALRAALFSLAQNGWISLLTPNELEEKIFVLPSPEDKQ